MIKIGITGGIGSGKSVVSEIFRINHIPVFDADNESKKIIVSDAEVKQKLQQLLGSSIFVNGKPDKALMASLIFNDETLLKQSNAIIHPAVFRKFAEWSEKQRSELVAVESAILIECGMNEQVDFVVTTSAPEALRILRTMTRDLLTEAQVKARIQNQLSEEEKIKKSDFVVCNDNKEAVIPQVEKILSAIKKHGRKNRQ